MSERSHLRLVWDAELAAKLAELFGPDDDDRPLNKLYEAAGFYDDAPDYKDAS